MGVSKRDGAAKNTGSSNECASFEQFKVEHPKNTGPSNDRAGFEQFEVEHPKRTIAVAARCSSNSPGAVLLYNHSALRVM